MLLKTDNPDFEFVACNLCGSQDNSVLIEAVRRDKRGQDLIYEFKSSGDKVLSDRLVRCNGCGLIFVNPRLRPELVFSAYSGGADERFVSQAGAREVTFERYMPLIEKYAPKGRLLDVGTAGGSFLNAAKKRGWDVRGVEPNGWMCEWGRNRYGVKIDQGSLREQGYKDNHFDVVTVWDVLEHLPDPAAELMEMNRVLKDGGLLIINYPNAGSLTARLAGRRWWFYLSVHLYYFTPRTLGGMLSETGFRPFKSTRHFQKLDLGYLLERLGFYNRGISSFLGRLCSILHLAGLQVPYYAGQYNTLSKKVLHGD